MQANRGVSCKDSKRSISAIAYKRREIGPFDSSSQGFNGYTGGTSDSDLIRFDSVIFGTPTRAEALSLLRFCAFCPEAKSAW